jgi:hypothetical protein
VEVGVALTELQKVLRVMLKEQDELVRLVERLAKEEHQKVNKPLVLAGGDIHGQVKWRKPANHRQSPKIDGN